MGAACVIRDEEGSWVKGDTHNLGSCSGKDADLWALLLGLGLAWAEGHKKTLVETDSMLIVSSTKKTTGLEACRN